jgi:diacylglycerol kinase family enzyme
MFPHAQKQGDRFQLRMSDVSAGEIIANLPKVWRGAYQGDHVHDFLCDEVELMVSRPAPFQSGGDLVGERTSARIKLASTKLSMI